MNRVTVRRATAGLVRPPAGPVPGGGRAWSGHRLRRPPQQRGVRPRHRRGRRGAGDAGSPGADVRPTPVLAWSVPHLGAVAGVMVTASHNPPRDNGYKVFLDDGSQIVSPGRRRDRRRHRRGRPGCDRGGRPPTTPASSTARRRAGRRLPAGRAGGPPAARSCSDVTRRLHADARRRRGDARWPRSSGPAGRRPVVVAEQVAPDPDFPTVAFPNPEEPGAMDLLLALAADVGADIALANDPDADRLGAAIPHAGRWVAPADGRRAGLAARRPHPPAHDRRRDRLVVTTLVSSSLLGRWPRPRACTTPRRSPASSGSPRPSGSGPDQRFVFGYEQALGYLVAGRAARQGRHHRGGADGRGGGAGPGRGRHAAGSAGRPRPALRAPHDRRAVVADGTARGGGQKVAALRPSPPRQRSRVEPSTR